MKQDIFALAIWNKHLNLNLTNLINFCAIVKAQIKSEKKSNRGYQSPDINLNEPVLEDLKKHILEESKKYLKSLDLKDNVKLDNIWINVNGHKDFNISHIHNGILSGVFYIKTPSECGNIVFQSPYLEVQDTVFWQHYLTGEHYNLHNSTSWKIDPTANQLLIFPSFLRHYVEPNLNLNEDRMSISFNII
tara:strand:+ start:66 stop:635 length:570 start_codon:yes stop_codon:yes gene_type:complete